LIRFYSVSEKSVHLFFLCCGFMLSALCPQLYARGILPSARAANLRLFWGYIFIAFVQVSMFWLCLIYRLVKLS